VSTCEKVVHITYIGIGQFLPPSEAKHVENMMKQNCETNLRNIIVKIWNAHRKTREHGETVCETIKRNYVSGAGYSL
jgi:hypothetical protein